MRVIKLVVAALVSVVVVAVLAGCQSKKEKVTEFLYRYGNTKQSVERMYTKASLKPVNKTFSDFDYKITSLEVKNIKTKDINGEKKHFVKCKMAYTLTSKSHKDDKIDYIRYMALVVEENGFGDLIVDLSQSKEVFVAGQSREVMDILFSADMIAGEEMIS